MISSLIDFNFFQPLTTPVGATSKVMQLVAILKSKNSQSVSLITWGISAFTNSSKPNPFL